MVADAWAWVIEHHYELIVPVWLLLLAAYWIIRIRRAAAPEGFFPFLLALLWTPFFASWLLLPDATWPTYTSAEAKGFALQHSHILVLGLFILFFHPGYVANALMGIYAARRAAAGKLWWPAFLGYGVALAFLAFDEWWWQQMASIG